MADLEAVERRAYLVSRMLNLHGGGIAVLDFSEDEGVVKLGFTGLCTACWMRPVTLEKIVKPAFLDLEGVTRVEADGVRISRQAQKRLTESCGIPVGHST